MMHILLEQTEWWFIFNSRIRLLPCECLFY